MNRIKVYITFIMTIAILAIWPNTSTLAARDNGHNSERHHHGESGNFSDDYQDIEQGSLPDGNQSSLESHLNQFSDPGLAAGIEHKTDVYSETAMIFSLILVAFSAVCFIMYIKRNRNQY